MTDLILVALLMTATVSGQDVPVARSRDDTPPPSMDSAAQTAATRHATNPAPASVAGDPTADQIADWLKADASPVQPLDPRAAALTDGPELPRQIHGEVGAFVSNRGYGGYATTSIPLGQASELDLGVGAAQLHTRFGRVQPKSLSVGLVLDGRDVQRWLSRDRCNVPRWGVALRDDPKVLADGSCVIDDSLRTSASAR